MLASLSSLDRWREHVYELVLLMHVLFDLDGTLTDPKEGFVKSVQFALSTLGIELESECSLDTYIGPPLHETFRKLCGSDSSAAKGISLYRERYASTGLFENTLYDGIHACLDNLRSRADSIHVVTSKPTIFSKQIIDHFELDQ